MTKLTANAEEEHGSRQALKQNVDEERAEVERDPLTLPRKMAWDGGS